MALKPLWQALYSAVGDTLYECVSGRLLTRTTAIGAAGATLISVESTDRFPAAGDIAVAGRLYAYTSKTSTSFSGLAERINPTTLRTPAGLVESLGVQALVMDESQATTQLDLLRRSVLLGYAEGVDLDELGENYAIERPRGLDDTTHRALLTVLIAIEAGTTKAIRKVLEVLHGVGNFAIHVDHIIDPLIVKIFIPNTLANVATGKAYLAGNRSVAQAGGVIDLTPVIPQRVYAAYAPTDTVRLGTNYAFDNTAGGSSAAAQPERFVDGLASFDSSYLNEPILIDPGGGITSQHWVIAEVISATTLRLHWRPKLDGRVDATALDRFITTHPWFPEWVATSAPLQTKIHIASGPNAGDYVIAEWISSREVRLASSFTAAQTDITWELRPEWGTNAFTSYDIPRATIVGSTVTLPTTPPDPTVLLDVTTVNSAQFGYDFDDVKNPPESGLYLFEFGAVTRKVIDTITVAGVEATIEVL